MTQPENQNPGLFEKIQQIAAGIIEKWKVSRVPSSEQNRKSAKSAAEAELIRMGQILKESETLDKKIRFKLTETGGSNGLIFRFEKLHDLRSDGTNEENLRVKTIRKIISPDPFDVKLGATKSEEVEEAEGRVYKDIHKHIGECAKKACEDFIQGSAGFLDKQRKIFEQNFLPDDPSQDAKEAIITAQDFPKITEEFNRKVQEAFDTRAKSLTEKLRSDYKEYCEKFWKTTLSRQRIEFRNKVVRTNFQPTHIYTILIGTWQKRSVEYSEFDPVYLRSDRLLDEQLANNVDLVFGSKKGLRLCRRSYEDGGSPDFERNWYAEKSGLLQAARKADEKNQ